MVESVRTAGSPAHLERMMARASWHGARLVQCPTPALVAVRARGDAMIRLARVMERPAPSAPNAHCTSALGDCFWLRPDEWLFVGATGDSATLLEALEAAVGADDGAAVDVTGSRAILELTGDATRDVLASCCALDLHPAVLQTGRCAQSMIAKAPVLIHLVDDTPRWRLFVSPSHVDYVVRWLVDGMDGVRAETSS